MRAAPSSGSLAGIVVALAVAGAAAAWTVARGATPATELTVDIHYSHFEPSQLSVPVGVPVTFVLRNDDPIDHEWIVGDAAVHERHRTGTEPVHGARPTEVTIPAGETRRTTIVVRRGRARSRTSATCPATRRTA